MSSIVPPKFLDLKTAVTRLRANVNIIGVVTDFQLPVKSRGSDMMCRFSLADESYGESSDNGLMIRFFRPMQSELPALTGKGDVVLLRSIGIKEYSGMTIGVSNFQTSWTIFPGACFSTALSPSHLQLKHVKDPRAPVPTLSETEYTVSVYKSRDSDTFSGLGSTPASTFGAGSPSASSPANLTRRDKFALIKDVITEKYYDLVAQTVKIYPHNTRLEIYVSDYTSNNLLYNHEWGKGDDDESGREGDEYNYATRNLSNNKWIGPYGKMTLTVTLWDQHADFGRKFLKVNDFVHLRNVRIKWSQDKKLEGVLHPDRRYPDRVDVTILQNNENNDRVKDVLRRKLAYTDKFKNQSRAMVAQARALKRKEMDDGAPLSKNQARKKRQRQAKEQPANSNEWRSSDDKENNPKPLCNDTLDPKQNLNPNVRLPKKSEYDILSDAGSISNESDDDDPAASHDNDSGIEDERRWEWRFGLVLEDAMGSKSEKKATMEVFVVGQDAECLLKLDAENLRKSPEALETLREKLFLLWGDLEERKSREPAVFKQIDPNPRSPRKGELPKSKPFECCLKEYGVKRKVKQSNSTEESESGNDGDSESENCNDQKRVKRRNDWVWERKWRMFGCTIV